SKRPVDSEHLADHEVAGHGPPAPGIARGLAIVAHHEVTVRRDLPRWIRLKIAPVFLDVGLVQLLAVDVDVAVELAPHVSGQADDSFDENPADAARFLGAFRRRDDDEITPAVAEKGEDDEAVLMRPEGA